MRPNKTLLCSLTLLTVMCGFAAVPWPGAGAAMLLRGPVYGWTDDALTNSDWSDEDNWEGASGYPDGSADGAVFDYNSGTKWTADKDVTETIGELKILEKVDFGGDKTVTALRLIFDSTEGAVEMRITDGTLIGNP